MAQNTQYVTGTADPANYDEFESYLAGCNPCQIVDNIRNTVTLYKDGEPYGLLMQFREPLHDMLRKRWKETHGS